MQEPIENSENTQEASEKRRSPQRPPFRLAALQCLGNASLPDRHSKLEGLIRLAASKGAQVVLLPELIFHDYFCITEDSVHFDLAHDLETEPMQAMAALAAELEIVLVVPFYERRAAGVYFNSAAVYDADGSLAGTYRKMHIPDDPGFMEKYYFAPGDQGFKSIRTRYAKLGVLICWDQWYPEAARLTALQDCDVLLYPTAIGWDDEESARDPQAQALEARHLDAWVTMQRSHAIANGVYVAAANRTGREAHLRFWGNSFIAGPGGEILDRLGADSVGFVMVEVNPARIESERRNWPFLRDRRIDAYGGLLKRFGD
jgi:N-carbamoylputrescine amidase